MITLLFLSNGLTFEVKGTLPKDVSPYSFVECDVIGLGKQFISMLFVFAYRACNPEEFKNYKELVKEAEKEALLKKYGPGGTA